VSGLARAQDANTTSVWGEGLAPSSSRRSARQRPKQRSAAVARVGVQSHQPLIGLAERVDVEHFG
jgi:hypothetical protein